MIELLLQAERAMSVGLVDRAEVLYTQVAEADPQNSIAVVGLARVALERGDEAGALDQARRALAIDPENAAASRMVERLDEVLAYRADAAGVADVEAVTLAPPPQSEPVPVDAGARVRATAEPIEVEPVAPPLVAAPAPGPEPAPVERRRRSFLDRLFGRFRSRG